MRFLLIILLFTTVSRAQDNNQTSNDPQNMEVVTSREAHYPSGNEALFKYLLDNIKYPNEPKGEVVTGDVMVSFYVESDSSLSEFIILSDVGYGIGDEVVKVLKELKYTPSIQNGILLRMNTMLTVPIRVRIE